jgi:hypothetical protein
MLVSCCCSFLPIDEAAMADVWGEYAAAATIQDQVLGNEATLAARDDVEMATGRLGLDRLLGQLWQRFQSSLMGFAINTRSRESSETICLFPQF